MSENQVWEILEIEATKDENAIKAAYRTQLPFCNPEDHPEEFKALREAYDEAIRLSRVETVEEEKTEIDLFIDKATELYTKLSTRLNISLWKELFKDDICYALDTADEVTERFMVFLMSCYNYNHDIWQLFEKTFGLLQVKSEIREKFPPNFLSFMENQIQYESFFDLKYFKGKDDANYDEYIDYYYAAKRAMDNKEYDAVEESLRQIENMEIFHPYGEVERLRYELLKKDNQEVIEPLIDRLLEYDTDFYVECYLASAYIYLMRLEEGKKYIEDCLEKKPAFLDAKLVKLNYLIAAEDYEEAKEESTTFLDENGNQEEALKVMKIANEKLMENLVLKKNAGDQDSLMELGWCMFQNERFDECIQMLEEYTPDEEHTFDYYNLRGRCTVASGRYVEALPYLQKWQELMLELQDDGTEKYKKKIRRLGYSYYSIAICHASMAEEIKYDKPEEAIEKFQFASKLFYEAIEKEKDPKEILYYKERLSYLLVQCQEYENAIALATEVLEEEPGYYPAYTDRQLAYYHMRNGQGIIDDFYSAIELYDMNPENYQLAMRAFMNYDQYEDAERIYQMAKEKGLESDLLKMLHIVLEGYCTEDSDEDARRQCITKMETLIRSVEEKQGATDLTDISEPEYEIALLYHSIGNYEECLKHLEKAYELYPISKYLWPKADLFERHQEYDKAIQVYELMAKYNVNHGERLYRIARSMQRRDKDTQEDLLNAYKRAYEQDEHHPAVNDCISQIYHNLYERDSIKEYMEKAIQFANQQIECNPGSYVLINRGLLYLDNGQIEEAIEDFKHSLEYDANDEYAYNNIGYAYKRLGQFEEATAYYEKALALTDEDSKRLVLKNLYIIYLVRRDYTEAFKYLQLYEEHVNNPYFVYDCYEEFYGLQSQFDKAIDKLIALAKEVKDPNRMYLKIGYFHMLSGNKNEAMHFYRLVKENFNELSDYMKASYMEHMGEYYDIIEEKGSKAVDYYKKSLEYDHNLYVYACVLRYYAKKNKKKYVDLYFEKAINYILGEDHSLENFRTIPKYIPIHNYQLGRIYYYHGDYDKARECFEAMNAMPCAMCHFSECYEAIIGKGYIALMQGDKELAKEYFTKAHEIDPTDTGSLIELKDLE